jgi:hypothetical protein
MLTDYDKQKKKTYQEEITFYNYEVSIAVELNSLYFNDSKIILLNGSH